mgnify:CR=1 FL=1
MSEAMKEAETDLAISEAENQDMLKQLEEIKEQNMTLEKKYQTNKNKLKEQQERLVVLDTILFSWTITAKTKSYTCLLRLGCSNFYSLFSSC